MSTNYIYYIIPHNNRNNRNIVTDKGINVTQICYDSNKTLYKYCFNLPHSTIYDYKDLNNQSFGVINN